MDTDRESGMIDPASRSVERYTEKQQHVNYPPRLCGGLVDGMNEIPANGVTLTFQTETTP